MRSRGPRALLRNKENPELERIPRALAAPARLAQARAPRLPPQGCSPPVLPPTDLAGPGRRPGRGSQSGAPASPARPWPPSTRPQRGPGSSLPQYPRPTRLTPARRCPTETQPCPAPRARPSDDRRAGRPPGHAGQGWAQHVQTRHSLILESKPWGGAAGPETGLEQGAGPGEVTPKVSKLGGAGRAVLSGARGPSDRPHDRPTADSPSPPRALASGPPAQDPPSRRPRATAALTQHSGARGSCSLFPPPAPAAAAAPPGGARAAGGRGGGWRRNGPWAGASWRRLPVAGGFRSIRPGHAASPSPRSAAAAFGSRRSAGCARAAGGGGRSRAHASAPPLGPLRPRPEAQPAAASVCR